MPKTNSPRLRSTATLLVAILLLAATPISSPAQETNAAARYFVRGGKELGFPASLLLASVQAIANAKAPTLFVTQTGEDPAWLEVMEQRYGTKFEQLSVDQAVTRFASNAPQVIYDPGKGRAWTLSIATTMVGIHQALLAHHDLGHPTAFDCHGHWTNKVEGYRWALKELKPKCNPHVLVYLDEVLPHLRDFAIQQKAFTLNLDPLNKPEDIQMLEQILGSFSAQTRVFGWATAAFADKAKGQGGGQVENALVNRLSRHGMMLVPADFASNLSFYDQTGVETPKFSQPHLNRGLKLQPGKHYILLSVSDGDNLQYDLRATRREWKDPGRPKIPLAWTISPQLVEVAPAVLQTYYEESKARGGWDEFIAGPSGYAYVNPGSMSGSALSGFVQQSRRACEQADIHSVAVLDDSGRSPAAVKFFISVYAGAQFDALWLMAMPQYTGVYGHTAFASERFRMNPDNTVSTAQKIKSMPADNPFAVIYTSAKVSTLKTFSAALDDSCVVVSPTEMADLIRQWRGGKTL